ncbi:putative N6-adenine methyltransferase-domain-containing protein [Xylaria grammica]|nr:putative N6-adenine methyltransferase-domain-containing protein [Xylaria grammica]
MHNRTLSADALAALTEFYAERDAQTEKLEMLKARVESDDPRGEDAGGKAREAGDGSAAPELSIHTFTEDWNESQFWYSDETANLLANQLLDGTSDDSVVAVVSTPSVFVALRKITAAAGYTGPKPKTYLLEHDYRFAVFPEFVFYDFATPFKLPAYLKGAVDRMICDPPFLSDDCQTKMAMTLRWLAHTPTPKTTTTTPPPRVLICTGERMSALVNRLYAPLGVRTTTYEPVHSGLKNEFCCYANFECAAWRWKAEPSGEIGA